MGSFNQIGRFDLEGALVLTVFLENHRALKLSLLFDLEARR